MQHQYLDHTELELAIEEITMKTNAVFYASIALLALAASPAVAGDKKKDVIAVPAAITQSGAPDADIRALSWQDGKRQEMAGLKQVEKAQDDLKKAQKTLRKAQEKNAKQQSRTTLAREGYVSAVTLLGKADTAEAAGEELKAFGKAVDHWRDEAKDLSRTKQRVTEIEQEIATAQSQLRTGNELARTGREKMRVAETQAPRVKTDVFIDDAILDPAQ